MLTANRNQKMASRHKRTPTPNPDVYETFNFELGRMSIVVAARILSLTSPVRLVDTKEVSNLKFDILSRDIGDTY
jgi:hypothetical protein